MSTPNDSLYRFTAGNAEFSVWWNYDDENLWISHRQAGSLAWVPDASNVIVHDAFINQAGGAEEYVRTKVLPAINAHVTRVTGGATVPPADSFPNESALVRAVLQMVQTRLRWNGSAVVLS